LDNNHIIRCPGNSFSLNTRKYDVWCNATRDRYIWTAAESPGKKKSILDIGLVVYNEVSDSSTIICNQKNTSLAYAVKKESTLCEHCNYTFEGLKENMPTAPASVSVATIWKWEHRMRRWMEAYQGGLDAKQAQFQVKSYSSRCYTSHRRVPEQVPAHFDT
jgi:hypothetical protein